MSMGITLKCKQCDCELTLDCGEYIVVDENLGPLLDLTLTCKNDCGAPVLNTFVPVSDFIAIEETP